MTAASEEEEEAPVLQKRATAVLEEEEALVLQNRATAVSEDDFQKY